MIFLKEEFNDDEVVMSVEIRVRLLKQFFLEKYKLIDDSPPS